MSFFVYVIMRTSLNLRSQEGNLSGEGRFSRSDHASSTLSNWRHWLPRLFLVLPGLLFTAIASKGIFRPEVEAAASGISLIRPLGFTILRIGFGAFPLGCAIFIFSCVISYRRILTGLVFVLILDSTVLAVRTFGMLADGT